VKFKKLAQYLLSLALMVLFLYWAFAGIDAGALWQAMTSIPAFWVGIIVLTTLGTLLLRSWRWVVLMRPFAPQVSAVDASLALAICYAANLVIPRSGEVMRAVSLKWTRRTRVSAVLATVVVERILDLVWLIVFLGAAVLVLPARINQVFPGIEIISLMALAGCIAALIGLALVSVYRDHALVVVERFVGKISPRLAAKVRDLLGTFVHGLEALHSPAAYLEIAASSIILNTGYILIIYEAFLGMGLAQTYGLGARAALVIMVISSIGVIFPTPGAVGSYHAFFGRALMHLYALPQDQALACATAVHAIATLTYALIGGPALLWQRARRPDGSTETEAESAP
jgi:uncharacterized protein (TIRG00374 family)